MRAVLGEGKKEVMPFAKVHDQSPRTKLFELRFPIAPLEQQTAFARRAELMQSVLAQQSAALQRAEATFSSLLARAFMPDVAMVADSDDVASTEGAAVA